MQIRQRRTSPDEQVVWAARDSAASAPNNRLEFSLFVPANMMGNMKMRGQGERITCLPRKFFQPPPAKPRHAGESRYPDPEQSEKRRTRTMRRYSKRRFFINRVRPYSSYAYVAKAKIPTWTPAFAGATVFEALLIFQPRKNLPRIFIILCADLRPARGVIKRRSLFLRRLYSEKIPAHAGNTGIHAPRLHHLPVHPRACGEHAAR